VTWSGLWIGWVEGGFDMDGDSRWIGGSEGVVVSV